MARFIFSNTKKVLGLRGSICFGIANQYLLETLHRLLEMILIEFNLAFTNDELGDKILRRQESDKPMVFIAISVEDNDGGCPFDAKSLNQGLVLIEINLDGNEVFLHGKADIGIRVSNSCQLLATDSKVVKKIHQDQLFLLFRLCPGFGEGTLPLNLFSHDEPSFLRFGFLEPGRHPISNTLEVNPLRI
jgi:hypothetical protein